MDRQPNQTPYRTRWHLAASVCYTLLALALAAPVSTQTQTPTASNRVREGFLAVQKQVEAIKPNMIKSTVALLRPSGSGSGVIISPDGYVLTAAHVISGGRSKSVQVLLSDGRRVSATILGYNREHDYGLIKIDEPENLPVSPLGDSSTLRRGQWVLSTGHPLGPKFQRPPVLRIGRVLYLRRDEDSRETDSVMTDAPIISGDSGGPVFDLNGRVVGINSMVLQGDRRMSSIHVPVNLPKAVLATLKQGEHPKAEDAFATPFAKSAQSAVDALRSGDLETALKSAAHAAELDPTSARARLLQARAYARTGKTAPALTALEQACALGFNDPEYLKREDDLASLSQNAGLKKLVDRLSAVGGIPGSRKGDQWVLTAAGNAEPNVDRGVVRLVSGTDQIALGTVMSTDGDVLTKASELPEGQIRAVLPDGTKAQVERYAVSPEWDLALLKVRAANLPMLPVAASGAVGSWTFSPDAEGGVAAIGVVSVTELPIRGKGISIKPTSKAYLGVRLEPLTPEMLNELGLKSGVAVVVEPGFPAAKAGLRTGDIIFEVEGKTVADPDTFMDFMVGKKPGDTLNVIIARDEERRNITINLTERPANLPGRGGLIAALSGDVSRMQGPFPQVLQHDTVLKPNTMGGPLLDIEGKMIGLNIARADRTSTYAISAKDLHEVYTKLKQKP